MEFLTKLALKRQSVTIIAMLLIIAIGVFSFRSLEAELFPEVELNLIAISASYPAAGPEAVVEEITIPIEFAITSLPNVNNISSTSSEGQTFLLVEYPVGTDMKSYLLPIFI